MHIQLMPCPKEILADPLSKYLLYYSPVQCYHVNKEDVADTMFVQLE